MEIPDNTEDVSKLITLAVKGAMIDVKKIEDSAEVVEDVLAIFYRLGLIIPNKEERQ